MNNWQNVSLIQTTCHFMTVTVCWVSSEVYLLYNHNIRMCILYSPHWDVPGGGSKPGRARHVCCRLTTVTSSPWMPTSGRLKWHRAVMAAMLAASIRFPSWFSIWTSTLICHTLKHIHMSHHYLLQCFPSLLFACVLPSLQRPHTGTPYRCTWSSLSISPAVCSASLTAQTVWRRKENSVIYSHCTRSLSWRRHSRI